MVNFSDFDDDEHVVIPRRGYTDISRQDSSKESRNRFRYRWCPGEHLWDIDMNNNISMLTWWSVKELWRWRQPSNPYPAFNANVQIVRSGGYKDLIAHTSAGGSASYYVPFTGAKAWARADRLFVGYEGDDWRSMFYAKRFPVEMEIALFASRPKAGEIACAYVATHKFRVGHVHGEGYDRWSRVRLNRSEVSVSFTKNGTVIGTCFYTTVAGYTSGRIIWTASEHVFEPGDVLGVKAPSPLMGINMISASILASVIDD